MKRYFQIFILFALPSLATAQISNLTDVAGQPLREGGDAKVEGSPYFESGNWYAGEVIDINDKKHIKQIRYNAYKDRLEYFEDGNLYYFANRDVKYFTFTPIDQYGNATTYFFGRVTSDVSGINPKKFYRLVYEGDKIKLIEDIKVRKIKVTPNNYGAEAYDKYVFDNQIYLAEGNEVTKFKLTKSAFYKAFPKQKSKLKEFIKEQDLGTVNDSTAPQICSFLEENLTQ